MCLDTVALQYQPGQACMECAGPGYFRQHVRVFDPGWRGPQAKAGAQDTDTEDWGNDPPGALDRYALPSALCSAYSPRRYQQVVW